MNIPSLLSIIKEYFACQCYHDAIAFLESSLKIYIIDVQCIIFAKY
jgi:hypothetical protein